MKSTLAVLIFSMFAIAHASETEIPALQLDAYKDAVKVAMISAVLECNVTSGNYPGSIQEGLDLATSATINSDGKQPLLTFFDSGPTVKITVSTTADYKRVVTAQFEKYRRDKANLGDLRIPAMTMQSVLTGQFTCIGAIH